jgi:hypothetical protein
LKNDFVQVVEAEIPLAPHSRQRAKTTGGTAAPTTSAQKRTGHKMRNKKLERRAAP